MPAVTCTDDGGVAPLSNGRFWLPPITRHAPSSARPRSSATTAAMRARRGTSARGLHGCETNVPRRARADAVVGVPAARRRRTGSPCRVAGARTGPRRPRGAGRHARREGRDRRRGRRRCAGSAGGARPARDRLHDRVAAGLGAGERALPDAGRAAARAPPSAGRRARARLAGRAVRRDPGRGDAAPAGRDDPRDRGRAAPGLAAGSAEPGDPFGRAVARARCRRGDHLLATRAGRGRRAVRTGPGHGARRPERGRRRAVAQPRRVSAPSSGRATPATDRWSSFAGRLVHEKGVQTLLAALRPLRERHPGLRLAVAGTGTHEDALHEQARALRIARASTGWDSCPARRWRRCSAPQTSPSSPRSTSRSGSSRSRRPRRERRSSSPTTGGLVDLIDDHVATANFAAGDVAGLVDAVDAVLADPDAARRSVRRARRVLARDYTWAAVAERTGGVYDEAVGRKDR